MSMNSGKIKSNTTQHSISACCGQQDRAAYRARALPSLNPDPPVLQHLLRLLIVPRFAPQHQGVLEGPSDRHLHPARVPTNDEDGRRSIPIKHAAYLLRVPPHLVLDVHLAAVVVEALQPGHVCGAHGFGPWTEIIVLGPYDVQGLLFVGVEEDLVRLVDGIAREGGDNLKVLNFWPVLVVIEVRVPVPGAEEEQHVTDFAIQAALLYEAAHWRDSGSGTDGDEWSPDVGIAAWGRVTSEQSYDQGRSWLQRLEVPRTETLKKHCQYPCAVNRGRSDSPEKLVSASRDSPV